jgi:hypothetical protein
MTPHLPTLSRLCRATLDPRRFRVRHVLAVLLIGGLQALTMLVVAIGRMFDALLFRGYRRVEIRQPIFIVANPRSGTTFLHRLLSLDPQFSYIRTYQTIFPAVTFFRLAGLLGTLDDRLGGPFARLVAFVDRVAFGGWEGIHEVGLARAEEDEWWWGFRCLSPVFVLLFPFFDELRDAFHVDHLPAQERASLAAYYLDALKRRMYVEPAGNTLLAKNTVAHPTAEMRVQMQVLEGGLL